VISPVNRKCVLPFLGRPCPFVRDAGHTVDEAGVAVGPFPASSLLADCLLLPPGENTVRQSVRLLKISHMNSVKQN